MSKKKTIRERQLELLEGHYLIIIDYIEEICKGIILSSHLTRVIKIFYGDKSKNYYYREIEKFVKAKLLRKQKFGCYNYYVLTKTARRDSFGISRDRSIKVTSVEALINRLEKNSIAEYIFNIVLEKEKKQDELLGFHHLTVFNIALMRFKLSNNINIDDKNKMDWLKGIRKNYYSHDTELVMLNEREVESFLYKKDLFLGIDIENDILEVYIKTSYIKNKNFHGIIYESLLNYAFKEAHNGVRMIFFDIYNAKNQNIFLSQKKIKRLRDSKAFARNVELDYVSLNMLERDFKKGIPI